MDLNQKICYCFNAGTACKGCVKRLQETIDALLAEKA